MSLSSSDGDDVTIRIDSPAEPEEPEEPAEAQQAEAQPAEPQPAGPHPTPRMSKRTKVPPKFFSAK
jgi:hypothetical protein